MKSLVIGAGGFAGQHLIKELQKSNDEIYAAAKHKRSKNESGIPFFDLDIRNYDEVFSLITRIKPDRIYHLSAISSIFISSRNPQLTIETNVIGAVNVLEAVRNTGLNPRILLVGSAQEYGETSECGTPLNEKMPLVPSNIYAVSKCTQEMIGMVYKKNYNLDIIMARAFNHCGPGQSENFVVSDFCRQVSEIEKGKREYISVGNLSAVRDFTDVRDVVRAYTAIMEKGISGTVYNVGGGAVLAVSEILEKIISISTAEIQVKEDAGKMRPVDTPRIEADVSKLKNDTGWVPIYPIDQTISDTLEYWRNKN